MRTLILLIFLLLSLGPIAEAQTDSGATAEALNFETLTLDQAIAFALQHAPAIQEASLTVALADWT